MAFLSVFKKKKFWLIVMSLVLTAIVGGVCKGLDVSEEMTAKVVAWTLTVTGGGLVGGHIVTDICAIIKGLEKPQK